jgi:hypothetical protein
MDGEIALGRPRGLAVLEAKARQPKPRRSLEVACSLDESTENDEAQERL